MAVLVAIAIPVFTSQLERSKEATDMSNIRAAYAEVVADYLADGANSAHETTVSARQGQAGWQNSENGMLYTRVDGTEGSTSVTAGIKGSTYTVSITNSGSVTVSTN